MLSHARRWRSVTRGPFELTTPQVWLGEVYFPSLASATLVSATTCLRGGFKAMKGYLGLDLLETSTELRAGRPVVTFEGPPTFDPRQALVCVPEDAPPYFAAGPGHEIWLEYVERVLLFLTERTRGRLLGLFTNRMVLQRVGERLAPHFRALGLPFYWQGMPGLRKEEIMPLFRRQTESVLLGLDTFWYGVDFPGETCEYVVIPKLPFGPLDRYSYAQMARMGRGPHRNRIYLPQALAMFRQGCGRLLRSESDRGAIFLLDRRALEKRNADFLTELPRGPEEWQKPNLLVASTGLLLGYHLIVWALPADLTPIQAPREYWWVLVMVVAAVVIASIACDRMEQRPERPRDSINQGC